MAPKKRIVKLKIRFKEQGSDASKKTIVLDKDNLSYSPTVLGPFPLAKLPAELRLEVYRQHLTLSEPIKPTQASRKLSSFSKHVKNCPLHNHAVEHKERFTLLEIKCVGPKHSSSVPMPTTVLALLLTCRAIYLEAVSLFYTQNSFIFAPSYAMLGMLSFLKSIGPRRRQYLSDITFQFISAPVPVICGYLMESRFLTKLSIHIVSNHWIEFDFGNQASTSFNSLYHIMSMKNLKPTLRRAIGMAEIAAIRGLKTLVLYGHDIVWRGEDGQMVDINHPDAVGHWLREQMTKPRPAPIKEEEPDNPWDRTALPARGRMDE